MCCSRTVILSSPVFMFGALSDRWSRSVGSGGCVAFADCLTVFPLAVVHLVLVHGWDVLRVVPLVPGVQPEDAVALVPFPPFSVGRFFSLWPVAWLAMDACCIFIICSPLLDWVSCFRFFFWASFVSFLDPWTRACAHTHTFARTHALPLTCGRAFSFLPAWVFSLVSTFLPPFSCCSALSHPGGVASLWGRVGE